MSKPSKRTRANKAFKDRTQDSPRTACKVAYGKSLEGFAQLMKQHKPPRAQLPS